MKSVLADRLFHLKENGTTVRRECFAGLTTFVTMAYILAVNPAILGAAGMDRGAVFTASALAACAATLLMALLSNYPFALAPGMGLNAYFAYTVVIKQGYSWQMALAAVFLEGLLFIVLSVTSVREAIFNSIPRPLKLGVTWGIGLFILFIGLQNSKLIVADPSTMLSVYPFREAIASGEIRSVGLGAVLAFAGILLTAILTIRRVRGALLLGILAVWGGGHPLSAHRPLCPQRRAGHGQRPARLLRWSGRPQPGSHLYADGLHWAVHPQFSDSGALLPLCRCIRHPGRHYRHGLPGAHAG